MIDLYLAFFIGICIAIVGWSLVRLERLYQYPFFMASIFLAFILPQAIALVKNPAFVSQSALERVLLYASMCVAMCWLGYQAKPERQWLARLNILLNEKKLFNAAILLMLIAYMCHFMLSKIDIQTTKYGTWTGPATILIFFAGVLYIAFPIFLINALKKNTFTNWSFVIISSLPIIQSVINGRRQPTMAFIVTIGFCIFLVKRYIPPRWLILSSIGLGIYIIPLFGLLRGKFWEFIFAGDWQAVISNSERGLELVKQGEVLELRNAAIFMDASARFNQYAYGTTIWDNLVFGFVPGQIVGFGLKNSLQLKWLNFDLKSIYGYEIPAGTTNTGLGDSFSNFGYFGCLCFAAIAFLFRNLWSSSFYNKSLFSSLLYMSLIDSAMIGVTHGIGRFVNEFVFKSGVLLLIAYFCKETFILPKVADT